MIQWLVYIAIISTQRLSWESGTWFSFTSPHLKEKEASGSFLPQPYLYSRWSSKRLSQQRRRKMQSLLIAKVSIKGWSQKKSKMNVEKITTLIKSSMDLMKSLMKFLSLGKRNRQTREAPQWSAVLEIPVSSEEVLFNLLVRNPQFKMSLLRDSWRIFSAETRNNNQLLNKSIKSGDLIKKAKMCCLMMPDNTIKQSPISCSRTQILARVM